MSKITAPELSLSQNFPNSITIGLEISALFDIQSSKTIQYLVKVCELSLVVSYSKKMSIAIPLLIKYR